MTWLGTKVPYDRRRIFEAAALARARNKRQKAIALYRWVLAVERNNAELHARLAPLLAETGQAFDAWLSYRIVARAALEAGRNDAALGVYREAVQLLPREIQTWQCLAAILARGNDREGAVETLLEGSRHFGRDQFLRPCAIDLLRRAVTLEAWHFESVFELARHLARCLQQREASLLLDGLAERFHGSRLRRVRRAQLRIEKSPAALWRWLVSAVKPVEDREDARPENRAARRRRTALALAGSRGIRSGSR